MLVSDGSKCDTMESGCSPGSAPSLSVYRHLCQASFSSWDELAYFTVTVPIGHRIDEMSECDSKAESGLASM